MESSLPGRTAAARIGEKLFSAIRFSGGFGSLTAKSFRELFLPPFPLKLTFQQVYAIGNQSLVLVLITGFATGSVMALQFGFGLQRFGGTLYVPKLTALSILREMGPVFTSLLVAGRIGSGMASEIASMKVTQQIDAIRALGTSPIQRIVIPRLLACMIALPLLTLMADYIALVGSMLVAHLELNIGFDFFIAKAKEALTFADLFTGMAKTVVFAFFIAISACWKGLNTQGGTQGVGQTTTWVVVASSIFIMIADFFLTKFFFITVYPKY
ncbi:MAG: ABC transporter permease [Bdellovibrionales bacterium]|nr:ABC transporter permease [Bdellovibrionales bacterium]